MNSLSSSIKDLLHSWPQFNNAVSNLVSENAQYPVDVLGIHGSLFSYFTNELVNKITCKVDNMDDFCGIDSSCFIKYVTFYNKNECKSFSADVNEYLDISEQKFIVLDVCDFYEEK